MPKPQATPRSALAALLLFALGTSAPGVAAAAQDGGERTEEAAGLLAQANEHLEQRRYDKAAEDARRVMALGDSHLAGNAAIVLGLALHRQWSLGLDDASEPRLQRLLGAPGGPTVPPTPGDELLAEAAEAFRRAVELDPEGRNSARLNLALALYYLHRDDEAAAAIAEHVERGGTEPEALGLHACLRSTGENPPQRVGGEVKRPEKIGGANPSYHDLARAVGVEGVVILEAIIDEAGNIGCIRPLKRLPLGMTEAAMGAVRTWKFKPATLAGSPVKVYYTLTVTFAIDRRGA